MARVAFAKTAKRAFMKLWRLSGEPTARLIAPISSWNLPGGVSYSAYRDQFVDGSGNRVQLDWSTQPATTIKFLPRRGLNDVTLAPAGIMVSETTSIRTLWTEEIENAVRNCWGVDIGGKLYRIQSWQLKPLGVPTPFEIDIDLVEGD